jgi:hypothetical protein
MEYIKGAMADPPAYTTSKPRSSSTNITGKSHHFFLSLRIFHKFLIVSIGNNF